MERRTDGRTGGRNAKNYAPQLFEAFLQKGGGQEKKKVKANTTIRGCFENIIIKSIKSRGLNVKHFYNGSVKYKKNC